MADLIKVNTNRLKTDASSIKGHISNIEKEIANLRAHNQALDAMWDGPSSEDIKSLEQMITSLKSLNEYEDNARDKYDECERKVSDLVSQIKVM